MKISLKAVKSDWKRKRLLYLFGTGMILGMISMHLGKKVLLTRTGLLDQDSLYHLRYISVSGNVLFWYVPEKGKKRSPSCHFGDYLDWQPGRHNGSFLLWSGSRDVSVCGNASLWSQGNPIGAGSRLSPVPLLCSGHCISLCVV